MTGRSVLPPLIAARYPDGRIFQHQIGSVTDGITIGGLIDFTDHLSNVVDDWTIDDWPGIAREKLDYTDEYFCSQPPTGTDPEAFLRWARCEHLNWVLESIKRHRQETEGRLKDPWDYIGHGRAKEIAASSAPLRRHFEQTRTIILGLGGQEDAIWADAEWLTETRADIELEALGGLLESGRNYRCFPDWISLCAGDYGNTTAGIETWQAVFDDAIDTALERAVKKEAVRRFEELHPGFQEENDVFLMLSPWRRRVVSDDGLFEIVIFEKDGGWKVLVKDKMGRKKWGEVVYPGVLEAAEGACRGLRWARGVWQ